jgi:uncharacterized membrane protein
MALATETSKMSAEEKQRRLDEAYERYMRGVINSDEFNVARRLYTPDLRSIARAIAERRDVA